jgi:hypothetical protein
MYVYSNGFNAMFESMELAKQEPRRLSRSDILPKSCPSPATHALNKMRNFTFLLVISFISSINALHFYLDANQKRCFIEELPTDTVVEGQFLSCCNLRQYIENWNEHCDKLTGHYRALEYSQEREEYGHNPELGIVVDVHVRIDYSLILLGFSDVDTAAHTGRTVGTCGSEDHRTP